MQEYNKREMQMNRRGGVFPLYAICAVFFLILGTLPALPSALTQVFRPVVIAVCFFFPTAYTYRLSRSHWALIIFHIYITFVFLAHPLSGDKFMAWAAMVLFAAFFILLTQRVWTRNEINTILHVVLIACVVFCLVLYRDNPRLFHNDQGEDVTFFGKHVNANSAAFAIVPGALVGVFFLFFAQEHRNQKSVFWKLLYLGETVLAYVMLVGMGGRSAFFAAVIGGIMIVWEWGEAIRQRNKRIVFRVLLLLLLLLVYHYGPIWTEGTHAYRLFDYDNLTDMNGRDDMAEVAMSLIREHPFFGGGFGYWDLKTNHDLMVHNSFLSNGVTGGFTAMILLVAFFVFAAIELIRSRSLIPLAFFVEALFHSLTEPGMDYYAYIPLILAFVIQRYCLSHNCMSKQIVQR